MQQAVQHTMDWRLSTLASWLVVTIACLFFSSLDVLTALQVPLHLLILGLLWWVIKAPNQYIVPAAIGYFVLIAGLLPLTQTSLVLIHLVMFTSLFSVHFRPLMMVLSVALMLGLYSAINLSYWQGNIPWLTLGIWGGFALVNGIVSRRFVESLNMHYQSRQNYKELKATQSMMAAMSAEQERLAISRELHDSLGHKLTALAINFDFLKRTAPADLQSNVANCHALSQEILAEVRQIVTAQRQDIGLLKSSLQPILTAVPNLQAQLNLAPELEHVGQEQALCLIRFCQEMLSNTLKHTQATQITFSLSLAHNDGQQEIVATAVHNHKEQTLPKFGNGLKGLSERLNMLQGTFRQQLVDDKLLSEIRMPLTKTPLESA
ncbi:sensor histidine kinase [Pseudoalteromonas fenneropenaei]|uniref:Sensor histidine kinase n=1 Tax=Pseudoalteromonas fenneropenaei TaxID=1737459 RepID=A0ABV7CMU4_9GAMM